MVSEIGCFQPAKVGSLPKEFTFFQVAGFLPASLEANDEKSHKTVKFQVQARACFGICSFPTISTFGRNPNKVFGAVSFCFLVSMYAKSDKNIIINFLKSKIFLVFVQTHFQAWTLFFLRNNQTTFIDCCFNLWVRPRILLPEGRRLQRKKSQGNGLKCKLPSWELTYPLNPRNFEDGFSFSNGGPFNPNTKAFC